MACDTSTGPVDTYVPEFNIFPRRSLRSAAVVQSQVDTVKCTRISKEKQKSPNNSSTVPCVLGLFCIHCNSERFDSNQLSYSTITKLPPPPQSSVYRSMLRLRNNCKCFCCPMTRGWKCINNRSLVALRNSTLRHGLVSVFLSFGHMKFTYYDRAVSLEKFPYEIWKDTKGNKKRLITIFHTTLTIATIIKSRKKQDQTPKTIETSRILQQIHLELHYPGPNNESTLHL